MGAPKSGDCMRHCGRRRERAMAFPVWNERLRPDGLFRGMIVRGTGRQRDPRHRAHGDRHGDEPNEPEFSEGASIPGQFRRRRQSLGLDITQQSTAISLAGCARAFVTVVGVQR